MRLDFNVLWVEDNQANVHAQRDRIQALIRKEGFRLRVKFASSVDQAKEFLSDDIYGDHIDLILMDYDLGPGKKGDEGLAEVREIFPYKDIIFYSGMAPAELMSKATALDVQGVFASHRNDLPDIVEGVFENLVRKVLDIDHSRGIVMGATSDIDQIVNDLLIDLYERSDAIFKKTSLATVIERVEEKQISYQETTKTIVAITHIRELMEHHGVYTSDDRLRLLKKSLTQLDVHKAHHHKLEGYRNEVMPKRNDLAHIRVEANGFSRKIFDRKGIELTSNDMRALRVKLLEYQECFDELLALQLQAPN
ncbi:response regulator [Pseudomonas sp. P7759]|uniref:response regulator n=1 Tax=Pseudomonas sp. P7759 TaxID=2738831 RepID=UPI0015A18B95|nr:response regulator [Pseudomonas sp. P7759]NWC78221.1 response regulator [Pseudomonas sp. P7759]